MFEGLCCDAAEVFGDDRQGEIYSAVAEIDSVPDLRGQEAHAAGVSVNDGVWESFPSSEQKIILEPVVHSLLLRPPLIYSQIFVECSYYTLKEVNIL